MPAIGLKVLAVQRFHLAMGKAEKVEQPVEDEASEFGRI
jgi:hypothetical protein